MNLPDSSAEWLSAVAKDVASLVINAIEHALGYQGPGGLRSASFIASVVFLILTLLVDAGLFAILRRGRRNATVEDELATWQHFLTRWSPSWAKRCESWSRSFR